MTLPASAADRQPTAPTIYALSSGMPPAAIAILRISGPLAFEAVRALGGGEPPPRRAKLALLRHPQTGEPLDRCIVLRFPGPGSATGEDLAELHLHGGRAVVRAVEAALGTLPGLRPAEPGEFTRRALASGRIDLTEAEGLADLLQAETESQRRAAMFGSEGVLRRQIEGWLDRLLGIAATAEALIDFEDEGDVAGDEAVVEEMRRHIRSLAADMAEALAQPPAERIRDGIRVVLAGPPNAGKSTLFNALVGREAAIVTPIPGTTRDRIEAPVAWNGMPFLFIDTAGLAEWTDDPVERIGIERSMAAAGEADILLWLGDGPAPTAAGGAVLPIAAKADAAAKSPSPERIAVSALTGEGIDGLWAAIGAAAAGLLPTLDRAPLNERQRQLCGDAREQLELAEGAKDLLILAEALRSARMALLAILGRGNVEDMLDALFRRFCIGK